jgi:membrane protein YdbS with pleckstrin-like domain
MSRIQTVDYAEGAILRLFGLASVTVTTASAAGALEIAGLDKARALELVDELTIKADAVEGDAT